MEDGMARYRLWFSVAFLSIFMAGSAVAATISWAPSTGETSGYYLHYGTSAYSAIKKINVGNKTQYNLDAIPLTSGKKYYFWVTAYNAAGESKPTQAIPYTRGDTTPPSPPKGLTSN
jgi:hypothetical protein